MQAKDQNFALTFPNNTTYMIPNFQRSYVWQESNLYSFVSSLLDACNKARSSAPGFPYEYFMGTIMTKRNPSTFGSRTCFDIIDGQQRITTFVLLFKAMSVVYNSPAIFDSFYYFPLYTGTGTQNVEKFQPNPNIATLFGKIIKCISLILDENGVPAKSLSKKQQKGLPKIIFAYNYLCDFLKCHYTNSSIYPIDPNLVNTCVKFVYMELSALDLPQVYFDCINSLGVSLTCGELVKNFISTDQTAFSNWMSTFEGTNAIAKFWNQSITIGRNSHTNLDRFLLYFIQVIAYETKNIDANDKKRFALANKEDKDIANNIKIYTAKYLKNNIVELMRQLSKYATVYKTLNVANSGKSSTLRLQSTIDEKLSRLGYLVSKFDVTTIIPYVLYVCNNASANDAMEIMDYLESYLIRRKLDSTSDDKNFNRFFRETLIGNAVVTLAQLKFYTQGYGAKTDNPTDNQILSNLNMLEFRSTNDVPKALMFMLEMKLNGSPQLLLVPDCYTLEHLMPQKPNLWPVPHNNIYKLGNMAIITQSLNSSISNGLWHDKLNGITKKKKYYPGLINCGGGLATLSNVLKINSWSDSEIDKRTTSLIKEFLNIWKY